MPSTQEFEELSCYLLPGHTTTPADAIDEAQQAELLGLGRVWLSERFDVKDAGVICSAALSVTKKIRVATAATNIHTRHPMVLATMCSSLHYLSAGRFELGIARGVTILMEDGLISDTILYHASTITEGMNKGIFTNAMLFIYSGLSFFMPSSSGMAVLTMPIMSPLADTVNIGRETIVDTYQYGMGLFFLINPTGLILAALAIVKIGFNKWLKFIMPLFLILLITTMVLLTISVY